MAVDVKSALVWMLLTMQTAATASDGRAQQAGFPGTRQMAAPAQTAGRQPQQADPEAAPSYDLYWRRVLVSAGMGQACAILDPSVFAHAHASLDDLRLLEDTVAARGQSEVQSGESSGARPDEPLSRRELPFATTLSEPEDAQTEEAPVSNRLVTGSGHLTFDLAMPPRPYTAVRLEVGAHDFVASAKVSGEVVRGGPLIALGSFSLFDLTSNHLSRDMVIPLEEATFPVLHVDLSFEPVRPGGDRTISLSSVPLRAIVPPSREAQSLYTLVEQSSTFDRRGSETIVRFHLPIHVPIERVTITLPPDERQEFSRRVEIRAQADSRAGSQAAPVPAAEPKAEIRPAVGTAVHADPDGLPAVERFSGTIFRVRRRIGKRRLSAEALSIPVAIGSNMQHAATMEVAIDDPSGGSRHNATGSKQSESNSGSIKDGAGPLRLASVRLEMRQRKICFNPPPQVIGDLTLAYGDTRPKAGRTATRHDGAAFKLAKTEREARLGPELERAGVADEGARGSATVSQAGVQDRKTQGVSMRERSITAISTLALLLLVTLMAAGLLRRRRG